MLTYHFLIKQLRKYLTIKKTVRSYVLDNFYANNVAAMPILYKLSKYE